MAENPLSSMLDKAKAANPGSGDAGAAGSIGYNIQQAHDVGEALNPKPAPKAPVMRAPEASPKDLAHPGNKYGTGPGEKRPEELNIPGLPKLHQGGTVPETGPYMMKKGEKVLTPEKHAHLKDALSLAQSALSHPEADEPKKIVKEMHIRKLDDHSHVIQHFHVHPMHPMEEHSAKNLDELHDHMERHWGEPNEGEYESENEHDESPGVKAMESAVGGEK